MLLTLNFFPDFFLFRLFFHPTFSKFSNVRFFFVAGCLRVPKGCLRGARFARNFFEKSFNSYLELEPPQHSVTRRGTFWRAARAERSAHWKLRNDKVNSFLLFGNRTKINETSPLFGGPYRNSDRQFFYSPIRPAWAISTDPFLDFCAKSQGRNRCL